MNLIIEQVANGFVIKERSNGGDPFATPPIQYVAADINHLTSVIEYIYNIYYKEGKGIENGI